MWLASATLLITTTAFAQTVDAPVVQVHSAGAVRTVPLESTVVTPAGSATECSCIKYARSRGVAIPFGTNAEDLIPNSSPHIGALILLKYPKDYHVAIIEGYAETGFEVSERNFRYQEECPVTTRIIKWNDPRIIGFVEA